MEHDEHGKMFYANGDADVGEWKDDMEHDEHGEVIIYFVVFL